MGTLDRTLPPEYTEHKLEGDRLLEEGNDAQARLRLESAYQMLQDFHTSELSLLEERLQEARRQVFESFMEEGRQAREAGETEAAERFFRDAREVAPDASTREQAQVAGAMDATAGAEADVGIRSRLERLQEAIEADPDAPEPLYNLGVELALDGFLEAAADQFRQVIELTGDDAETRALAYFRLANVHGDLLRHTEAEEYHRLALDQYRKALDLGYEPADVHFRIGQLHEALGDHEAARQEYQRCLERQDDHLPALSCIAHCHEMEEQHDEALAYLEKLVALDPEDSEAFYRIGVIKERAGDDEAALSAYESAEKVDPDGEFAYYARERSDDLRLRLEA